MSERTKTTEDFDAYQRGVQDGVRKAMSEYCVKGDSIAMRPVGDWIADWRFKYSHSGKDFDASHETFIKAIQEEAYTAGVTLTLDKLKQEVDRYVR